MKPVNFVDAEGDDDIIPLSFYIGSIYLQSDQLTNYIGGYDVIRTIDKNNKLVTGSGGLSEYAKECVKSKILKFQFVLCGIMLDLPAWGESNLGWMGGITKTMPTSNNPGSWGVDLGYVDLAGVNSGQTSSITYFDITDPFDHLYFFVKKYRSGETTQYPLLIHPKMFKSGYTAILIPRWGDWY